jgi:ferritin-like metal-binding protein YciE
MYVGERKKRRYFMKKYTALDLLFETGLRHMYHAENAILKNLFTLADSASSSELKKLFLKHQGETEGQIQRLEEIFEILEIDIKASKLQGLPGIGAKAKEMLQTLADLNFSDRSKGIDGILKEGDELLRHFAKTDANEFALIGAGQKVEYFEIACYNFLSLVGEKYENQDIIDLLEESLSEEMEMEERISEFAEKQLDALLPS